MTRKERLINLAIRWEKIENEFFEKKKEREIVFLEIKEELSTPHEFGNYAAILGMLCTEVGREVLSQSSVNNS